MGEVGGTRNPPSAGEVTPCVVPGPRRVVGRLEEEGPVSLPRDENPRRSGQSLVRRVTVTGTVNDVFTYLYFLW